MEYLKLVTLISNVRFWQSGWPAASARSHAQLKNNQFNKINNLAKKNIYARDRYPRYMCRIQTPKMRKNNLVQNTKNELQVSFQNYILELLCR